MVNVTHPGLGRSISRISVIDSSDLAWGLKFNLYILAYSPDIAFTGACQIGGFQKPWGRVMACTYCLLRPATTSPECPPTDDLRIIQGRESSLFPSLNVRRSRHSGRGRGGAVHQISISRLQGGLKILRDIEIGQAISPAFLSYITAELDHLDA